MTCPRLHVVTDDDVLRRRGFRSTAEAMVQQLGSRLAFHLRGPDTPARELHDAAAALAPAARKAGALFLVNDRADVALAVAADGVALGRRSMPLQAARELLGRDALIGYSAHGAEEAESAEANGADFVVLGTIWDTPSHPGRPGAGVRRVAESRSRLTVPLVAIGGVTPERAVEARAAGAHGVAVIRGVWSAPDAVRAALDYIEAMDAADDADPSQAARAMHAAEGMEGVEEP